MGIFDEMGKSGHEQLIFCSHSPSRLRCLIAIHNTALGPALGGCRMWPYSCEEEAVRDALRLSEGMTWKSAVSGVNFGGGKAIIWGDPQTDKSEACLRAFGRFVEGLRGRFITGTDMGTVAEDFVHARAETAHLVALPEAWGGSGDSSVTTAFGVWKGIKACAQWTWGNASLKGRMVVVQGVGKVGSRLARHLRDEGARLVVADIAPERARRVAVELGAEVVDPDEVYDVECDIFSPNARGGVINDQTVPRLKCRVVAGGANNQLAEPRHGDALRERGILYAPDYVINAGGLIQVATELEGFDRHRALRRAAAIADRLLEIFRLAEQEGIATHRAADRLARERVGRLGLVRLMWLPGR